MVQELKTPQSLSEIEQLQIQTDEALASLTDKEAAFLEYMNSGRYTQVEAYRKAFDVKTENNNTVAVNACRLWNSTKFALIRDAIDKSVMSRAARSKEERIARLEALKIKAERAGNYGAAFQCEQALGKLEGHYVERSEQFTRHIDYAQTLKALERFREVLPPGFIEHAKQSLGIDKETKH